jgi:hypothetical protein
LYILQTLPDYSTVGSIKNNRYLRNLLVPSFSRPRKRLVTNEVITSNITIVIVDRKNINTVLGKKFDSSKLLLITTRHKVIVIYTERDIKKLVSNKFFKNSNYLLVVLTSIGALD